MAFSLCVNPTPHKVVTLHSAAKINNQAIQPAVTPTASPQPAEQPETPVATPAPAVEVQAPPPVSVTGVVPGCGDNEYANYIYMHESGCNTNALNSIGCYGIGQACPASKIANCGADYACQNAWFSAYADRAYGGWYNAYLFWSANHWW